MANGPRRLEVSILPIEPEQLSELIAFLDPFIRGGSLMQRDRSVMKELLPNGFVATHGEQIVGFASVQIYSKKMAELQALAVDPDFQGNGIGQQLIERCQQVVTANGIRELLMVTGQIKLAEKAGFSDSTISGNRAMFWSPKLNQTESQPPRHAL